MPKEFEIHKHVELAATPEQVWEVISTEQGLAAWFMAMPMDASDDLVVAWEPGKRLRFETPTGDDGSSSAFEYLIEARDGGSTVLRFVHSGFISDDWGDEFETTTGWGAPSATRRRRTRTGTRSTGCRGSAPSAPPRFPPTPGSCRTTGSSTVTRTR